jgi:hypothetical protein
VFKRTFIPTLLFLLTVQTTFGQTKNISIPTYKNGDTSLWFKWQQEKYAKVGLPNLTNSYDSLHFRFSTETQAIDIWTADFKTFNGTFANFTTSSDPNKYKKENPPADKFYSNKDKLDTATARQVYNIFNELSIFSIPTGDSIEGWHLGNDGDEYLIEYSTPTNYSFKEYWTPSYYKDKIIEAASIDSLAKQLETTLQMQKAFGLFLNTLPIGCYFSGSFFVTCTQKPKKKAKNEKGSR